jgi:biotin carboxylase
MLVIGAGKTVLGALERYSGGGSIVVVECARRVEERGLAAYLKGLPSVRALITTPGDELPQEPEQIASLLLSAEVGSRFTAVLPALEEGVVPAAIAADLLGLPGAGLRAARVFRDKALLRRVADDAGIAGPRWREIGDAAALAAALAELSGPGHVLKPLGASGSRGVLRLGAGDDPAAAWADAVGAVGGTARFLVEELMVGPEVSVETLVRDGRTLFWNPTVKEVQPGPHPVEVGHVLPGPLPARELAQLRESTDALIKAAGFGSGVLHSEWILTAAGPALVECAARIPGDRITDLLTEAYGFPFIAAYAGLMSGADPVIPTRAVRAAAIRFLTPEPAAAVTVEGQADALAVPGVTDVRIDATDKLEVPPLRSSSDRVGHVVATGPDPDAALAAAREGADRIRFEAL